MIHRKMLEATTKTFHLLKSMRSSYLVSASPLSSESHTKASYWWNLNWKPIIRDLSGEMELPDSQPLWWEQSEKERKMLGSSARWGKISICWRCWWAMQNWGPLMRMLRVTSAERWGTAFWGTGRRERKHKRNGDGELTANSRTFPMKRDREMGHHQVLDYLQDETEFQRLYMTWPKSQTDEWYLNLDLWLQLSLNPLLSPLTQTDPPVSQVFSSGFVFP